MKKEIPILKPKRSTARTSQKIVQARELYKARSTFIDSLLKHEHNGRIHGEINQLKSDQGGTITGRLSMSNPNLQQIPSRNEKMGPLIRQLFIPEEGCTWGSFDYYTIALIVEVK